MSAPKNNYTDDQKAHALARLEANGGNMTATARETGIPRKTIETWRNAENQSDYEEKKLDLAESLEALCLTFAETIAAKIKSRKSNLKELTISFGITVDKLLLLRGSPTTITRNDTASATATFDISNLDTKEVLNLYRLQMKACGLTEPQASDLAVPVICDMDEPEDQPEDQPQPLAENPTDEPATTDGPTPTPDGISPEVQ